MMETDHVKKKKTSKHPPARPWHVIANEHVGEYVLMEVTARDEYGSSLGHVIEVSPDRDQLHKRLLDLLGQKTGRHFFLFKGARLLTSGPEVEEAARKFVREFYEAKEAAGRAGQ